MPKRSLLIGILLTLFVSTAFGGTALSCNQAFRRLTDDTETIVQLADSYGLTRETARGLLASPELKPSFLNALRLKHFVENVGEDFYKDLAHRVKMCGRYCENTSLLLRTLQWLGERDHLLPLRRSRSLMLPDALRAAGETLPKETLEELNALLEKYQPYSMFTARPQDFVQERFQTAIKNTSLREFKNVEKELRDLARDNITARKGIPVSRKSIKHGVDQDYFFRLLKFHSDKIHQEIQKEFSLFQTNEAREKLVDGYLKKQGLSQYPKFAAVFKNMYLNEIVHGDEEIDSVERETTDQLKKEFKALAHKNLKGLDKQWKTYVRKQEDAALDVRAKTPPPITPIPSPRTPANPVTVASTYRRKKQQPQKNDDEAQKTDGDEPSTLASTIAHFKEDDLAEFFKATSLEDPKPEAQAGRFPWSRYAKQVLRELHNINSSKDLEEVRAKCGGIKAYRKPARYAGWYAVEIDKQWRILFHWENGKAVDVFIADYHND